MYERKSLRNKYSKYIFISMLIEVLLLSYANGEPEVNNITPKTINVQIHMIGFVDNRYSGFSRLPQLAENVVHLVSGSNG